MGKALGGCSSINAMMWSRGHKNDWDYFADEAGDPSWGYESVLGIYRRIEDWQGLPDPLRRGKGGLIYVEPARDPNPIAPAMLEAAGSLGIPTFDDQNGEMMEGDGGAAIANLRIRDGRRLSVFRTYVYPYMDRPNLTVLTGALVTRVIFDGKRAVGVEILRDGQSYRIAARHEIVLSLGAINTPKVLMQSGIGDHSKLTRVGIDVVQHLPGVGRNFDDHIFVACVWEYKPRSHFVITAGRRPSFGRVMRRLTRRICSRSRQSFLFPLRRPLIFRCRRCHGRCLRALFARAAEDTCASPGQIRPIRSRS
jgi:choline dehydrogenase